MNRKKMRKRMCAAVLLCSMLLLCACGREKIAEKSGDFSTSAEPSAQTSTETGDTDDIFESDPALFITELMVQNRFCVADDKGRYLPWVEIYNHSSKEVNLGEYMLSNGAVDYSLPKMSLSPGSFYVFFFEELEEKGKLTLTHGRKITHTVSYLNLSEDCSFLAESGGESATPTPGYENVREADALIFSEVMPSNTAYPVDGYIGAFVELYNAGKEAVLLGNYHLSDRTDDRYLCELPEVRLNAGEYIALPCEGELHFALSSFGSVLYLTRNDGVLAASFEYPMAEKNRSYSEGKWNVPSPGYPNTDDGRTLYMISRKGLLINEVLPSNTKFYAQKGEFYDLVELKNTGDGALRLSDYFISDSRKNPRAYQLPDVQLAPGQIYVLVCTGRGNGECPFKLSGDGEYLLLSNAEGKVSDAVEFPYVPVDRSWGRSGGEWVYFSQPTIGSENGKGLPELSKQPQASVESGFYNAPFEVTLEGKGNIYYTLDGSRPTAGSRKYSGEKISVTGNLTLRALCIDGEKIESDVKTYNYFVNALDLELPVAKLSVTNEEMYGSNGIYTNYNENREIEGHIAFYVEGKEEFSENCGVKIFGNYSRQYSKKSYQLKFRAKYGCSSLKYDIFGDGSVTEFNSIALRSGSQDQFRTMMRDELASGTVLDYCPEVLAQNYRPVNLYINDEYIGIYYFREKINDDFVASHWNVSPESVTIIHSMEWLEWGSSSAEWSALRRFILENDLSTEENYNYICDRFCMESVIDYCIALCWVDNRDDGNTRICKSDQYEDGKWHFIFFDSDLGFGIYLQDNPSTTDFLYGTYQPSAGTGNPLIYKLLKNQTFRERLLRRLAELTDTAFAPETTLERIEGLRMAIDHDMQYVRTGYGVDKSTWERMMPQLISYTSERAEKLRREFADLLNLSESEKKNYFG